MSYIMNQTMTPDNFIDVLNSRIDIIFMNLTADWDSEKAAAAGRQSARTMILDIVESYNEMPVEASDAFTTAINAWKMGGDHAQTKVTVKINFARTRGTATTELETKKLLLKAYFDAGKELTERILNDLAEEVSVWEEEDGEGEGSADDNNEGVKV